MSRRGTKKVREWKFDIGNETITIPVYMVEDTHPYATDKTVKFRASYQQAGIDVISSDINKLKERFEKEIKNWYEIDSNLFIMIHTGAVDYSESRLEFGYRFYQIGARPDGEKVHFSVEDPKSLDKEKCTWDGVWEKKKGSYSGVIRGEPKIGKETNYGNLRSEGVSSLLPATIENVEAALKMKKAINTLGKEMMNRFAPERIIDTFSLITGKGFSLMLPEPIPEEKTEAN